MLQENSVIEEVNIACWACIEREACKIKPELHKDVISFYS